MIKSAIKENDFLYNMMDDERLNAVIEAMTPKMLEAGTFLITEGETGSSFYVSAEGDFEVIKDKRIIKSFKKGVVFGELAILYKAKRFASIKGKARNLQFGKISFFLNSSHFRRQSLAVGAEGLPKNHDEHWTQGAT